MAQEGILHAEKAAGSGKLLHWYWKPTFMQSKSLVFPIALLVLALQPAAQAQDMPSADPPHRDWKASWATHPTAPLREPIVLHFRRELSLASAPASYPVRVSADNRFILYVNGRRVGEGPARGDLTHWRY